VGLVLERMEHAAGGEIPNVDLAVPGASRGQAFAVGAERNAEDGVGDRGLQRALPLAGGDVPDRDDLLQPGGNQLPRRDAPLTVRAESDTAGPFAAPGCLEGAYFAAAGCVPKHDLLIPAGRGEPFAGRTERD